MPIMSSLKATLESLRAALKEGDYGTAADRMSEFAARRGDEWLSSAGLEGLLPKATSKHFAKELRPLLEVLQRQLSSDDPLWKNTIAFVMGAFAVQKRMKAVSDQLGTPEQSGRMADAILFEFATWIEDQNRRAVHAVIASAVTSNHLDTRLLQADILNTAGGNPLSGAALHETLVESFQLICAYFADTQRSQDESVSPPMADFASEQIRLSLLASAWRVFADLYERLIFESWRILGYEDRMIAIPGDVAEARRRKVGEIRWADQLATAAAIFAAREVGGSAFNRAVASAAERLNVAPDDIEWSCEAFDENAIRDVFESDPGAKYEDALIGFFLYSGVAADLVIQSTPSITWTEVSMATRFLRAVAAVVEAVRERSGAPLPWPLITNSRSLIHLLARITSMDSARATAAVNVLTFSAGHRELELWDTPLIPMSGERILISPAVITNALGLRRLENMATQWRPQLFDRRGRDLERLLGKIFENAGIPVQSGFKASGVEFDVVVFWEGWLFLLEAKCTKSVFSPRDAYRAKSRAREAVVQLKRRRRVVHEDWVAVRNSAKRLELPSTPLPDNRIVSVAVMNIPHLTTAVFDGVIVTDNMCVERYFSSDPEIAVLTNREQLGTLGTIRDAMSPDGFVEYLKRPPQVAYIDESLHEDVVAIAPIGKELPLLLWNLVYKPKHVFGK